MSVGTMQFISRLALCSWCHGDRRQHGCAVAMLSKVVTCEKSSQTAEVADVAATRSAEALQCCAQMQCCVEGPQMQIRHVQAQRAADALCASLWQAMMVVLGEGAFVTEPVLKETSAADLLLVGVDVNSCYIASVTMLPDCQASFVSV